MTNKEAINVLNDYDINFERNTAEEVAEAHEMAIKALEAQPCEDCIRRSDASLTNLEILMSNGDYKEALKMLLDKIEKAPSVTLQPKERTETHECDCISRKAVLDALHRYFAEGFNEDRWWNSTYVLDAINKVPSVTPQPKAEGARGDIPLQQSVPKMPQPKEEPQQKTGYWVLSGGYWRCSECKEKALLKLDKATGGYREYEPVRSKYCPECGAKMQEVKK